MTFRFVAYGPSSTQPNVVVDGSPNEGTVLAFTHWPGFPQPPRLRVRPLRRERVIAHLRNAPSAWDPYRAARS